MSRLENARTTDMKTTARCPACAERGGDRRGEHLVILPSGRFGCAAFPGDQEHRRRIFALVGVPGDGDRYPGRERVWQNKRDRERQAAMQRQRLIKTARQRRASIIARHPWSAADVWEDSPQQIGNELVEFDPRWFLGSLFPPEAILWTGEVHESGQNGHHADRWRTCTDWQSLPAKTRIGPMTTPATWKTGTTSRSYGQVLAAPYTILDFDGCDGIKPETLEQLRQHCADSLALIRWLREGMFWDLAAILWTGGKSLHAWFHSPAQAVLESLRITAAPLGLDAGLIGRPEHPCRLPGHPHAKTGKRSRVLWLQLPHH